MMKKNFLLFFAFCFWGLSAQEMMELKQVKMSKWKIGTGQFSGITSLGDNRYAVVSDKEPTDGFFLFRIDQNATTGEVESVYLENFYGNPSPRLDAYGVSMRDTEGIAYFPPAQTLFISGEGDQQILEYSLEGVPTGRGLLVPPLYETPNIVFNYGFEALSYSNEQQRFWTITESTLKSDGVVAGPEYPGGVNLLRLQSFTDDLLPAAQYAYRMDVGKKDDFGKYYCFGVPSVVALPEGGVLVLERELDIPKGYMSAQVICKIFLVHPNEGWQIDSTTDLKQLDTNQFLYKKLVAHFTTQLHPFKNTFANYEGMCLGRTLDDGRRTLLLLNDSQSGAGWGPYRMQDYIKVLIF